MESKFLLVLLVAISAVAAGPHKLAKVEEDPKLSISTTTATQAPIADENCEDRTIGGECNKNDCRHCGFCIENRSFFIRCNRVVPNDPKENVTGIFVKEECDGNLWWNPDAKPKGVDEGGACDTWDNLSDDVQDGYKNDPRCVEELCEYGQDDGDKCTEKYWYYDPKVSTVREDLSCSTGLLWDPKSETCRNCVNVDDCVCEDVGSIPEAKL